MQIQWNPRPFKRDWEVDEWVLAQKQTLADPESFSSFISTNQDQHETSPLILKSPHKKIEVNDFSLLLKQWVDFKTASSQCGCNNPFGMRSGQTTYHNTRETDGRMKTPEIVITKWSKKCGTHIERSMLNAVMFSSTHFFFVTIKERRRYWLMCLTFIAGNNCLGRHHRHNFL